MTKLLLLRHEEHVGNVVTPEGVRRATERGGKLNELGYRFDLAVSSPLCRAIATLYFTLTGTGKMIPITTEPRLGDPTTDLLLAPVFRVMNDEAKLAGISSEQYMITSEKYRGHVVRRSQQSCATILEYIVANPGKTIAVCSHSGARLEPLVATLQGKNPWEPDFYFEHGACCLLEFDDDANLIKVEYLGRLVS